jgi:hypothetical protein
MDSGKVTIPIGCNFKSVVTVQIINLDSIDFVIGLDMIKEYKMDCSDSLPHDGPEVRQLDNSPFRVKLSLKDGIDPQGRRPYRIPETCRSEMENTYSKILQFKLIESSMSHYSNPVFLVSKSPVKQVG